MDQKKSPDISFKPLSEGLGINHFSDGLPYASQGGEHKRRSASQQMTAFQFPRVTAPPEKTKPEAPRTKPAPLSARVGAFFLDVLFIGVASAAVLSFGLAMGGFDGKTVLRSPGATHSMDMMIAVMALGYFALQEAALGTTLGKSLFRIKRIPGIKGLQQWL